MANSLENLILSLLRPNNETLSEGFEAMHEAFKDPGINIALCECMSTSQHAEVRKYAAVLLRKKFLKMRQWKRVPPQTKQGIKDTVLRLFVSESDSGAHGSVTQLIAVIAKQEFRRNQWPELMQLLNQCIQSNTPKEKEMGLYAMSILTSYTAESMKPHLKILLSQFSRSLLDLSSINIPFHTIECLTNLVCVVGSEEMNQFQALIPSVLQISRHLVGADEAKACKALEIFDELIECEVAIIAPHIKLLIGFCLEIAGSASLQPNIRVKALSIIGCLAKMKQKSIIKHKLVGPILDILVPVMCQPGTNDEEEDEEDELSPVSSAGQVIDMMALHLPPEKLLSPLMHHFEKGFKSDNPYHRKGAYLAMGVIAEGCSEYIRNKHLQNFLQIICKGMKEENCIVRNAALFCFGQYAQYLQPDFSKYASDLLPLLFEYLIHICQMLKNGEREAPLGLGKTFLALEVFCENLGDELLPYLPSLMELLMSFLSTNSLSAKERAIGAIGAVATAAKGSFVPYFPAVIENLKVYISEKTKENMPLKIQAIDTLGQLARTVGNDVFMPMAHDCMVLGLELVDQVDDPDLRRCVYNLISAVADILKADMAKYMELTVNHMIGSIQSSEGISTHYISEDRTAFTLFEDDDFDEEEEEDILSSDEDDEEDGEEITGLSVENAYLEEKEAAVLALRQISTCLGVVFIPYLDKCFEEIKKQLENPSSDVRRESITCLSDFCITLNDAFLQTSSLEYRLNLEQKINAFLPKLFAISREDTDRGVVSACLEALQDMTEKIKKNFLYGNTVESIVALIKDVFRHKLACQGEEADDEELDDQEAEYDTMLFEYAGDIIPSLIKIVPSEQFAPYLAGLLPFLLAKTKRSCTIYEKSFAIGILAEAVNNMEPGSARRFLTHLLPVFLKGMTDDDDEVRSNSVFGLGVLIENVTESLYDQYPALLQALSNMLSREQNPRAKDNICSTVSRMIRVNASAIPLKQVFPALLQCLPLKVDMDENKYVYQCLSLLHSQRCEEFFQNLPSILKILSQVLSQEIDEETKAIVYKLVKDVHSEFPSDFEAVLKSLPPEGVEAFGKVLLTPQAM